MAGLCVQNCTSLTDQAFAGHLTIGSNTDVAKIRNGERELGNSETENQEPGTGNGKKKKATGEKFRLERDSNP